MIEALAQPKSGRLKHAYDQVRFDAVIGSVEPERSRREVDDADPAAGTEGPRHLCDEGRPIGDVVEHGAHVDRVAATGGQSCFDMSCGDDLNVAQRRTSDALIDRGAALRVELGCEHTTVAADVRGHRHRERAGTGADVSDLHSRLKAERPRQTRGLTGPCKRREEERESPGKRCENETQQCSGDDSGVGCRDFQTMVTSVPCCG